MPQFGAIPVGGERCRFAVWAPKVAEISLILYGRKRLTLPMRVDSGFHIAEVEAPAGTPYRLLLPDGRELPDPASRFQPDGVHGVSVVVDPCSFHWTDAGFSNPPLNEAVIYELHVGTFTQAGTFAAAIPRLDSLVDLGNTAVELMPVAQFPGAHNWGYDGVFPFAVQNSYGGPAGLAQFVNAAHERGISVFLDVVYNHLGPEGNYLGAFCPFFSDRYRTPWGEAVNFDGAESGPVRAFFIQNALYWLDQFHIDGLRLDAIHGIFDFSAHHFLAELNENVQQLAARTGRRLHVIAESDLNDSRLLRPHSEGGYALDAQWSDDLHHAVHTLLTHETFGYYRDFGSLEDLRVVLEQGWRYSGQYSEYRQRCHGNSPAGLSPEKFVVCIQNHDQVGNRAGGERLAQLVDHESLKLAAGVLLLSPFVPLLFMGEEYGETNPFQYFTSHGDPGLASAVTKGRREEFAAFGWSGDVPDPQDESTFHSSILNYSARDSEPHRHLLDLYKFLIALRKRFGLGALKPEIFVDEDRGFLTLTYAAKPALLTAIFYFGEHSTPLPLRLPPGESSLLINSSDRAWIEATPYPDARWFRGDFLFARRSFAVFETRNTGGTS